VGGLDTIPVLRVLTACLKNTLSTSTQAHMHPVSSPKYCLVKTVNIQEGRTRRQMELSLCHL